MIGTSFSHYRITSKLGEGGMGVVYRAHDERLDRDVAIKVLPEEVAEEPDRLARFEREARAAAALDHTNILAVQELGEHKGRPFIVTELLEGENLRSVIDTGGLTARAAIEYAVQIANGLAAAHDKGITHRDLKPENLFLTRRGPVKILDFGIAELCESKEIVTADTPTATLQVSPSSLFGTVAYMAPEQIQGRPSDQRSDIFSLGVVLYEMLTGRRPFQGGTEAETAAAILKQDLEPVSSVSGVVPLALAGIVSRCLEKRPEDRFQSAHDVALALRAAEESPLTPPSKPGPTVRRRWPHMLAVVIAAATALLVVLPPEGLWQRLTGNGEERPPIRSLALLPLENLTGDPEQAYFVDGLHEELISTFAQFSAFDKVIARTSVMGFRDSDIPIREIGRQLDVEAVLEGSVRRSGDTVRATLQLVDARTEENLWAESFDRNLTAILALQGDVARAVAHEIRVALTPQEEERLAQTLPVKQAAYEAYLKGDHYLRSGLVEDDPARAIEFFEKAIEEDPSYAPAYVGLSTSLRVMTLAYRPPSEVMPQARAAVLRALELDDGLAAAQVALGPIKEWDSDWPGAEAEYRRALELSPNHEYALRSYGLWLVGAGRFDEGIAMLQRAVQLNPLNLLPLNHLGWAYFYARRYDEGIEHLLNVIELYPKSYDAHFHLSWNYWGKGLYAEAVDEVERAGEQHPDPHEDPFYLAVLAFFYGQAGRAQQATDTLERVLELRDQSYVPPVLVAVAYLAIDDSERAIEWLERGCEVGGPHVGIININPVFDPLRSDPRFQDILRRMYLPED
jgi:serine/threonine protein kinase/tetratricopeptide (TPR) repeat protein